MHDPDTRITKMTGQPFRAIAEGAFGSHLGPIEVKAEVDRANADVRIWQGQGEVTIPARAAVQVARAILADEQVQAASVFEPALTVDQMSAVMDACRDVLERLPLSSDGSLYEASEVLRSCWEAGL